MARCQVLFFFQAPNQHISFQMKPNGWLCFVIIFFFFFFFGNLILHYSHSIPPKGGCYNSEKSRRRETLFQRNRLHPMLFNRKMIPTEIQNLEEFFHFILLFSLFRKKRYKIWRQNIWSTCRFVKPRIIVP